MHEFSLREGEAVLPFKGMGGQICICRKIGQGHLRFTNYISFVDINVFDPACKVLKGYRYHKLRKAFSKFYRRHNELIIEFNVG